jgi:thioredoxin reductase
VYAARKMMNFLVISEDVGGQTILSGDVENYLGYHHITGQQLVQRFEEHMKDYNIQLQTGEKVLSLEAAADAFEVKTSKNSYKAKTVIIASGKKPRKLNVKGEEEFRNRGVTYCATCDAPLFAGKTVAVIGGGNSALDAVLQLIKIANKIYLINRSDKLKADKTMVEKAKAAEKVEILNNSEVKEIFGEKFVKGIKVKGKEGEKELAVEGVFVEAGLIPSADFDKITKKNKYGEIIVDKHMRTSVKGVFAAGDVNDTPEKQIIVAAGEGSTAALNAFSYLSRKAEG